MVDTPKLVSRCTKEKWDSDMTENWQPYDIACIQTCPSLKELKLGSAINSEEDCEHNQAIAFSAGSKCQLSCAAEDEEVTIPEITCQEDGNWNFEISDLQCSKKKIEIYPTSIPIESSSDSLTADDDDSEKSVGAAGIAVPLIVLIIIGGGLAYFFLVYKF